MNLLHRDSYTDQMGALRNGPQECSIHALKIAKYVRIVNWGFEPLT